MAAESNPELLAQQAVARAEAGLSYSPGARARAVDALQASPRNEASPNRPVPHTSRQEEPPSHRLGSVYRPSSSNRGSPAHRLEYGDSPSRPNHHQQHRDYGSYSDTYGRGAGGSGGRAFARGGHGTPPRSGAPSNPGSQQNTPRRYGEGDAGPPLSGGRNNAPYSVANRGGPATSSGVGHSRAEGAVGGGGAYSPALKGQRPASGSSTPRAHGSSTPRAHGSSHDGGVPEPPHNPNFVSPIFPQLPITTTESSAVWALMMEQAAQAAETVLGPLLEAIVCECSGTAQYESELQRAGLPVPPFSAQACMEVLSRHPSMPDRMPLTIRKRVEAATEVLATLSRQPAALTAEAVTAGQTALKNILLDVLKAMRLPSLLKSGSRQFLSFMEGAQPAVDSAAVYMDTLLADCAETAQVYREREAAAHAQDAADALASTLAL